jgi:hypothetical protein
MALDIIIQTVPHSEQAYETLGNYESPVPGKEKKIELTPGKAIITVSEMGDWRSELLVALHELVELSTACWVKGVKDRDIVKFDKAHNKKVENGESMNDDPGCEPDAPYHMEHMLATFIENGLLPYFRMTEEEHMLNLSHAYDKILEESNNG